MTKVIVAIGALAVLFCGQSSLRAQDSDDATKAVVKEAKEEPAKKEKMKEAYDSKMESHREAMIERAGNDPAMKDKIHEKMAEEGAKHQENMMERAKEGQAAQSGSEEVNPEKEAMKTKFDADLDAKKEELKAKAGDDPAAQERAREQFRQYRTDKEAAVRGNRERDPQNGGSEESVNKERTPKDKTTREATKAETAGKKVKKEAKKKPKE